MRIRAEMLMRANTQENHGSNKQSAEECYELIGLRHIYMI